MIARRSILLAVPGLALMSRSGFAAESRLTLSGTSQQGSLMVGRTEPGARVTLDGDRLAVSDDGYFAFGFSYNRIKPVSIALTFRDGAKETRDVVPEPRKYDIQRIDGLPQEQVTPPPDIVARIQRESADIGAKRKRDTDLTGFAQPFDWPVPGIISSVYGSQRILNGTPAAPHLGVDVAAPEGTPIVAPADAVVSLAADHYLNGGFTLLDHGHGVSTCYLHQRMRLVKEGDKVKRGQKIGEIGVTGRATGPNLHWGLNWFAVALDVSLWVKTPMPPKS